MSKKQRKNNSPKRRKNSPKRRKNSPKPITAAPAKEAVDSLLRRMEDGNEFGSLLRLVPTDAADLVGEIIRGLAEIEAIRRRPCLAYVGNVVKGEGQSGIDSTDDLPFAEMIANVPRDTRGVDVFLATNGGSAHQVSRFVNMLRGRFEGVEFLLPSFCMSAGTLFALSGDGIWMTPRACLGPIDPQVPSKDGRFVPAQALLLLVEQLQRQGQGAIENGMPVPWAAVRIIDGIDKKELADAISASSYSTMMATEFLTRYKFRNWQMRDGSGEPVTDEYRVNRAKEIANALASHERWKNHGHAIAREVLWDEIKLKVDHPDPDLERAMVRLWALLYWVFDNTPVLKLIVSRDYRFVRQRSTQVRSTP